MTERNENEIIPSELHSLRAISTVRSRIELCLWKGATESDRRMVVKKSLFPLDSIRMKRHLTSEISILLNLNNQNIVSAFGYVQTPTEFALVMEHCPLGSYQQHFVETNYTRKRSEKEAALFAPLKLKIIKEIVCGMEYLHSKGILHLNIKAEHVLLGRGFTAKLSNFGSSKMKLVATMSTQPSIGTSAEERQDSSSLLFTGPEHLANLRQKATTKSDVYAFGILTWQMLTDLKPYDGTGLDMIKLLDEIKDKNVRPDVDNIPKRFPPDLVAVVKNSWNADAASRSEFPEIRDKIKAIISVEKNFDENLKQAISAAVQLVESPTWKEVKATLPDTPGLFRVLYASHEIAVAIIRSLHGVTLGYTCEATDVKNGVTEVAQNRRSPLNACENAVMLLIKTMVSRGIYPRPDD